MNTNPTFTIIAGVNGSGKTTFALDYFKNTDMVFINADLIAMGLSPNNVDSKQFAAAKLMIKEIDASIEANRNFAIETTLSSKNYLKIIHKLKQANWNIELLYLYLPTVELSIQRVAERVKIGGHNIKTTDIKRRYSRSVSNLINFYMDEIETVMCFDNSNNSRMIFSKKHDKLNINNQAIYNDILEYSHVR